MNDLISRLSEIRSNYNCFDEKEEPYYRALSEAIQLVSAQLERKRGKWINQRADSEMCSACGTRFYISALFAVGGNDEPNYCPNCGADMRGENDV